MSLLRAAPLALCLVLAVGCGSSTPPTATPAETTSGERGERREHRDHEKEHAGLSPALKEFHGALAPVWHGGTGAVRVEKACADARGLHDKAKATGDAELVAATAALEPACAAPGRLEVEAKLTTVHERFHVLAGRH
jgi:hypothetical protein